MKRPKKRQVKRDRNGYIRCRVCGCTTIDGCPVGCDWVKGETDLCTTCDRAARTIRDWLQDARRANWAALRREVNKERSA